MWQAYDETKVGNKKIQFLKWGFWDVEGIGLLYQVQNEDTKDRFNVHE
jgi:hypothetical protein